MESRMKKYYEDDTHIPSRQAKNMDLYKDINSTEIDDFNINSNIAVLDDNGSNIDIQRIRDMLDKKYRVEPKQTKIADYEEDEYQGINLDETREYDINTILEKAREKQTVNYEVDRLKKIRNTQFDILNSLDLEKNDEEDEDEIEEKKPLRDDQAHLMDLINTITSKELGKNIAAAADDDLDPLDILTDLKGDDNTVVVPGLKEEIAKFEEEFDEIDDNDEEENIEESKEVEIVKEPVTEKKQEEPKTNALTFDESDFEDFNDLRDDVKNNSVLIKILAFVLIILLIGGIVFMLNGIMEWGLF